MALTTVPASLSATALTLTTAAQPNITSVGTLTGLAVTGNATITKEGPTLTLTDSSSSRTLLNFVDDNNSVVRASGPLLLQSGGAVSALTLDASRNATFAGNVTVSTSGSTALTLSGDFPRLYFVDTAGSDLDAYIVNNANGLFFGKTNSPTSSNDVMMLDLTNQRVGIGQSTPLAPLEIKSTDDPLLILHHTEASDNAAMHFKHGGTTNGHIYVNNDRTMYFSTVATNPAMVIKVGGNVGIGTGATANYRLDLMDTIADQDPILYAAASGTPADAFNWIAEFMAPNIAQDKRVVLALGKGRSSNNSVTISYVQRADANNNALTFGHFGNNDLVSFCYSGNVGIGTTTPAHKLDVEAGANQFDLFRVGSSASDNSEVTIGYFDANATNGIPGLIGASDFGGLIQSGEHGNLVLGIRDNDATDGVAILSGGGNFMSDLTYDTLIAKFRSDGKVGFGTNTPESNFHVRKTAVSSKHKDSFATSIVEDTESRLQLISANTGDNASALLLTNVNKHWIMHHHGPDGSNTFSIGYHQSSSSGADFVNSSSDALNITTGGNVGIGTNNPASWAKLEVVGTAGSQPSGSGAQTLHIKAPTTTANEGVGIRLSASSGSKEAVGIIGMVNNASGNSGSMTFHTYNGGATIPEVMRIDNNGKVGIGTNNPTSKLHTYNLSAEDWRFENGTSGTTGKIYLKTRDNSDLSKYIMMSGYWTEVGVHNNEGFRIRGSDGNIKLTLTGAAGNLSVAGSGSDRNFKKDIKDIDTAIDIVKAAKPKTFEFIKHVKRKAAGFIAQDMQEILPDLVSGEEYDEEIESSGLGFDYIGYTAYLTKAIQEQQTQIEALQAEVKALKGE